MPSDCRVCGRGLLEARRVAVCEECLADVAAEPWMCCYRCGERLALDEVAGAGFSRAGQPECETCMSGPPEFVRALSFGPYRGRLRDLIRLHKFEGMQEVAPVLGDRLVGLLRRIADETAEPRLDVVAVPLHGSHRRYNQSQQVADAALRRMRRDGCGDRYVPNHGALRRVRATQSQSHLTPAQRRTNVRGAFAASGDLAGRTVVLVDDVYTTGATAAECTRVLLGAGAAAVYVATLARTQPDRVERWGGSFD